MLYYPYFKDRVLLGFLCRLPGMTQSNIKGGFRGAGLVPLDPESIILKLDIQL
jgi:hypothetical protein